MKGWVEGMSFEPLVPIAAIFAGGVLAGAAGLWAIQRVKLQHFKQLAKEIIQKAEKEGDASKKAGEFALRQQHLEQQREFEHHWPNDGKFN
jgi:hypothetical protein